MEFEREGLPKYAEPAWDESPGGGSVERSETASWGSERDLASWVAMTGGAAVRGGCSRGECSVVVVVVVAVVKCVRR